MRPQNRIPVCWRSISMENGFSSCRGWAGTRARFGFRAGKTFTGYCGRWSDRRRSIYREACRREVRERFSVRLTGAVQVQPFIHGICFLQTGGLGELNRALLCLLRVRKLPGFGVSHGKHFLDQRLIAAAKGVGSLREDRGFVAIA